MNRLYDEIKNPIDDINIINNLIMRYSTSDSFYSGLVKSYDKNITGKRSTYFCDKFYAMMFNKWKNSIIATTREEFIKLHNQGSYGEDFIKLRRYLKSVSDVTTMKEANDILFGHLGDIELENAMDKYRWNAFGEGTGWHHVCSRYLTAKKDKYPNVEHRLYVNSLSVDTHEFMVKFVEKCEKYKVPFYFKFDEVGRRDDSVVIYSSTENLHTYIDILKEIKKENPELISRFKKPPVLTGVIDGFIGYGSEPKRDKDGNHSFNEIRSKHIKGILEKKTYDWIRNHRHLNFNYKGKVMTFSEYFTQEVVKYIVNKLVKKYEYYEQNDIEEAQKNGKRYNPADTIRKVGYNKEFITSPSFFNNAYSKLFTVLDNAIRNNNFDIVTIQIRDSIKFDKFVLQNFIKSFAGTINMIDQNFAYDIQNSLKNTASNYGIDKDNYSFDVDKRQMLINYEDKHNKINNYSNSTYQNNGSNNPYNNNVVDYNYILKRLENRLKGQKRRMPFGYEIDAMTYYKDVVLPLLPKSGKVILRNGAIIPISQFIDEMVESDCQVKYDGDIARFITDKTVNNSGIIKIRTDKKIEIINPSSITNYINKDILNTTINMNNRRIPAKQFIEEVYAQFIPEDGFICLKNGNKVDVQTYIERVLIPYANVYNGDIRAILQNTTLGNTGTFDSYNTIQYDYNNSRTR